MSHRKSLYRFCSVVALASLLTGCSCLRTTIEVPVYLHDTTYSVREVHDSIHTDHWHTIEVKGDTVFIADSHIYVTYRTITDTAYKYVEKPVEVVVSHTKEVAMPLKLWQKSFMWVGVASLLVALLCVLAKCWQKLGKR